MSLIKYLFILLIRLYRFTISPFFMPCCKFYPTCSRYTINAINKFGLFKGFYLSIIRIINCNPFNNKAPYDPVP